MAEYTLKNNEPIPQKRKKKGLSGGAIALIVVLSLVVGLPLITAGVIIGCFYDPSHTEVDYDKNATLEDVFDQMLVDSLDDTRATTLMHLELKERQLNTIMKLAFGETEDSSPIKNFFVDADDGIYTFKLEVSAYTVLKTTVSLRTELNILEQTDCDVLEFSITDIRIGRVGGFTRFKDLVLRRIDTDAIKQAFDETGLSMELDLENLKIIYKSTDFYDDMIRIMGDSGGSDGTDFVQIISEILLQDNLRDFYYEDDTIFGVGVPINELRITSGTYNVPGLDIGDSVLMTDGLNDDVASEIKSLLDSGVITTSDNLNAFGSYILGGYNSLKASDKQVLDIRGQSVFGPDYKDRVPLHSFVLPPEKTIKNIVDAQTKEQMAAHPLLITPNITTSNIDDMLRSSNTMGTTNYFVRNLGDEAHPDYKVNYVALDNLTSIIKDNALYVVLNINFNGYCGHLTLKGTKVPKSSSDPYGSFKLHIDAMYLGNSLVGEKTKETFMDIITDSLDSSLFDVSTNYISFDIASTMAINDVVKEFYDIDFSFTDSTVDKAGFMTIVASKK